MKVFVLGLDGATWDLLEPLLQDGLLPNLARLREQGSSGSLRSVFPPLSPVAWTGVMTGKNSGKHGIFEFLEHGHNPLRGRVNSSRAIQSELLWEIAARYGKKTVAGGVPMSYPPRPAERFPGFFLGDFLSPADARRFHQRPGQSSPSWNKRSAPINPGRPPSMMAATRRSCSPICTRFLEQHLKTVRFLMNRCEWDLFIFDLMATDRFQHELWHAWDLTHRAARGRERELEALRPKLIEFWQALDRGIGAIEADLPSDASLLLISDHGFGPIEHYVNFNVWLLEHGYIALEDSFYVKQKHWFYRQGATPEWIYGVMSRLGLGNHRVSRFRGKQEGLMDRLGESLFLSRRHIDWSRTRAYAQGNFGQIFLNVKGRQPHGCVAPEDVRPLLDELKAGLHGDPPSRDRRAAGRACLRARRALPRSACRALARSDGGAHRLAVSHDRPARLHDEQGDHAGVRADRRSSAGGNPDRRGAGVPGRGRTARRGTAGHCPHGSSPAGSSRPRRHGRPGTDRTARAESSSLSPAVPSWSQPWPSAQTD